eukprot:TRINITY_DN3858_c0_g1_i2.p1 TRINITY_DN3858_c0_g1~~TRINITY_DN3858_c0_g1_i2.p1  ORF type:complete len:181 (-),score=55.59 TRINITY_DN3858_c0_g1_i2:30-572(-)
MEVSEEGKLNCEFQFATFSASGSRRRNEQSEIEKELSLLLVQSLEVSVRLTSFPKSILDIYVLVLQDGGAVLSAACTGCSLALADACVEMFDLVTACSVAKLGGEIVLDPSTAEEHMQQGGLMVSCMPSVNEITQLYQFGELSHKDISESLDLCLDACKKLHTHMSKVLAESTAPLPAST